MSLFSSDVTNLEELRSAYPKFLTDIYEFDEILKVEAMAMDKLQKAIDLVIDNHFIDTMDDYCLSKLEKYLHLSSYDRSLKERRALVKSLMLGKGRISMSQLVDILSDLSGGKVTGEIKDYDELRNQYLSIHISDCTLKNKLIEIISIIEERIPAHLMVGIYYHSEKIDILKHHSIGSVTNMNQIVSTMGTRYENCDCDMNIQIACRSTITDGISVIYNVIFGGTLDEQNIDNQISGGTMQYVHNNEINGGTLS